MNWPSEINEFDPDPDDPGLPTGLDGVVADLDSIRSDLGSINAELIPSSFVWMVWPGMRLDLPRHASLFQHLNQSYGIFTYAYLRRMADFQNRVLENYATSRGLNFLDVAAGFPRDPSLVWDAIHNTPEGVRVRAWVVFQQIVPILRERITSGRLPQADQVTLKAHPGFQEPRFQSTTWGQVRRSCP